MKGAVKNVAASVHARLLAGAQERREDFNLTLQRYAAERFLYRLGASRHREQFVLKGAMLFALWGGSLYRATRDLDLTGYAEENPRALVAIIREICAVSCPGDGLTFQAATVRAEPIRDKSEYHGFRVKLRPVARKLLIETAERVNSKLALAAAARRRYRALQTAEAHDHRREVVPEPPCLDPSAL